MQSNVKNALIWKFAILIISIVTAAIYLLPATPAYKYMPNIYKDNMPNKGLTLGLDLQGGLHLIFEVQSDKAVATTFNRMAVSLKDIITKKNIPFKDIKVEGEKLIVESTSMDVIDTVKASYPNLEANKSDSNIIFSLPNAEMARLKDGATDQALETIRNRIDAFGVSEPVIQRQGSNEIIVELPGIKDPKRAIDLIGKTAQLKFQLVNDESPVAAELPASVPVGQEDAFEATFAPKVPQDSEILFERITKPESGQTIKKPFLIKKEALLTGDLLTEARVSIDSRYNEPYVSITFNSVGAALFADVTGKYVKKRLAIILDNNVYSAPAIQEKISGGNAQITGSFSMAEAKDLAIVLRAGALPAPVKMIQNLTVGPSLGADSVVAGKMAGLGAIILVIGFMIFYYRLSGVIADLALIVNIFLLLGIMSILNATMTLPGIAGIILAIGMAVDTNVLMFERMREEVRAGKTARTAINSGYDKAFYTIIDSHVTTLITAAVLFQFGTGPIKGFAVTLSIGVTLNLFTSLIGTKSLFDLINYNKEIKNLSI
jgi:preprotein translocase subunit SecD